MHPNKGKLKKIIVTLIFVRFGQTWYQIIGKNFKFLKKNGMGGVLGVKKYQKPQKAFFSKKNRLAAIFITQKSFSGYF